MVAEAPLRRLSCGAESGDRLGACKLVRIKVTRVKTTPRSHQAELCHRTVQRIVGTESRSPF